MEQNNENRKSRRYVVEGIHGNVLNITDVDILNISIEGTAVETPKRLELNREYTFKIKYQDDLLHLRGRVVWAMLISKEEKDSNRIIPVYRVGIKFIEILSEKADMLQNFIEENKIKTLEHRLGGIRFQIANNNNIKLSYPYKCRVKKMSTSGMLIETEYPLNLDCSHSIELFVCDRQLNIVGRVANCEKKNDSAKGVKYDIGIEFTMMLDEDSALLKDFLRTLD